MAARTLIVACGALAGELETLAGLDTLSSWEIRYLPAELHNRPGQIAMRVEALLREAGTDFDRMFVAYADCGTRGELDRVLRDRGVERLPGAHCYEVFTGREQFAELAAEEPGSFYLTDFLVRNFERLVIEGLGIDRHPQLLASYFGNYRRVVYLSQSEEPALLLRAQQHAERLGLAFEHRPTGLRHLAETLQLPQAPRAAWPS